MALFALSDLHLSLSSDKPMDVFGSAWQNHTERIRDNWNNVIHVETEAGEGLQECEYSEILDVICNSI